MKVNLTNKFIDELQPVAKRQIFFDSEAPGLALFITAHFVNTQGETRGGHKSFYYIYTMVKGTKRQLHLGAYLELSLQEARAKVTEFRNLVAKGIDPSIGTKKANSVYLTVDECMEKFFKGYINIYLKNLTRTSYTSFAKNYISPILGSRIIDSINYQDLTKLHLELKDKPATANRVLAVCSKFLSWCEKEGFRSKGLPTTRGIERYKEKPILKFLNLPQMKEIWFAVNRLLRAKKLNFLPAVAVKLLLLTGARKNEILGLKWTDIEMKLYRAILQDSKTGFKIIYFPRKAIKVLNTIPHDSVYLFPSCSSSGRLFDLQWQWRLILKEANLEGRWRIHDLRHGFASVAVNFGGSLSFIAFLLGHKRAQTTERYAHVAAHPAQTLLNEVADAIAPDDLDAEF
jgi:integrase